MPDKFYVTADQEGRRIDRLLRARYPQVPLSAIMKALRKGEVRLDAKKAPPDRRLEAGQLLQTPWSPVSGQAGISPAAKKNCRLPETIYRDGYVWIVNKPAGLLTQPDVKGGDSLITRIRSAPGIGGGDFRPATVQRLDRNTSGVVLVALSGKSLRYLSQLIRERKIKKIYRAVVAGDIPASGRAEFPLLKDPETNAVSVCEGGLDALTIYRKLKNAGDYSLVELELVTGRSHQARAHMSALGCPILGDIKYGGAAKKIKRPLLHALSVEFPSDEALPPGIRGKKFTAGLPEDMLEFFTAR